MGKSNIITVLVAVMVVLKVRSTDATLDLKNLLNKVIGGNTQCTSYFPNFVVKYLLCACTVFVVGSLTTLLVS